MQPVTVILPHGSWVDGVCHREADLRPLCGHDEAFLVDEAASLLPVQKVTALLARCVTRIGDLARVTRDVVLRLTMGDREALLLHLRRLAFGERMQAVVTCPDPACATKMDLPLAVADLLLPPFQTRQERHELTIARNGAGYRAVVRVPTGADAEAAAPFAAADPSRAAEQMLRGCVLEVVRDDGSVVEDLPPEVAGALADALAGLDPQAELKLALVCVQCGRPISAIVDTASYFFREIAERASQLDRESHLLAFHYHWSEAEIMGMTPGRRRRYLGLLLEELRGQAS